jgi:hypothetical protein
MAYLHEHGVAISVTVVVALCVGILLYLAWARQTRPGGRSRMMTDAGHIQPPL